MVTILVAVISGIILCVMAALWHNGLIDYMAMTIAVLGISIPNFVLAVLLIQTLAVNGIFATARWESPVHMLLPVIDLATGPMATIAMLTRSIMVEVHMQDYIKIARAKGHLP